MARQFLVSILALFAGLAFAAEPPIANRLIDYDAFKTQVAAVGDLREQRRLTESEFIRFSAEPSTIILDARSREKFELLHVKGATNLSLPDITAEELAKVIPSKTTRILIYCNNNFLNEPMAFPAKLPSASLNIHTINVLYAYGYTRVYELGPLLDIRTAKIVFEGSRAPRAVT
ncbi:MAG TPA: rhodanese-like domain-containing protein [Steroidobacteraceae bacterium]|nr:rhodanese-like domain-containing protein [Steroidobacteraceae bacterium]